MKAYVPQSQGNHSLVLAKGGAARLAIHPVKGLDQQMPATKGLMAGTQLSVDLDQSLKTYSEGESTIFINQKNDFIKHKNVMSTML